MIRFLSRFLRAKSGATAMEYGIIVALLSVVVIASVQTAGKNLYNTMNNVSATLTH
jgi:pilus assembly protein Flp/PilA